LRRENLETVQRLRFYCIILLDLYGSKINQPAMEKQKQAYACAFITVLLWATVASAFKISLRYLDFLNLLLYSSATSAVVLFLILQVQNKLGLLREYSRKDYMRSALLGFLSPFIYYVVLFKAYSLLPAQEAQPLNQTWVIMISILSIILLKQKIGFTNIFATFTSFIGVLIISTHGDISNLRFSDLTGVSLALGSAVIWSLFWVYNIKDERDEAAKLFLNFTFGFAYILITMIIFSKIIIPDTIGVLGAVYIGLFEMGVTFVIWLKALKLSRTTTQVSNFIYLIPFLSLIVIYFTVGETILSSTIIGLIFIFAGILIQQYAEKHRNII